MESVVVVLLAIVAIETRERELPGAAIGQRDQHFHCAKTLSHSTGLVRTPIEMVNMLICPVHTRMDLSVRNLCLRSVGYGLDIA